LLPWYALIKFGKQIYCHRWIRECCLAEIVRRNVLIEHFESVDADRAHGNDTILFL